MSKTGTGNYEDLSIFAPKRPRHNFWFKQTDRTNNTNDQDKPIPSSCETTSTLFQQNNARLTVVIIPRRFQDDGQGCRNHVQLHCVFLHIGVLHRNRSSSISLPLLPSQVRQCGICQWTHSRTTRCCSNSSCGAAASANENATGRLGETTTKHGH